MALGTDPLLCRGRTLRLGEYHLRHDFCEDGSAQRRAGVLYHIVVFPLVPERVVESDSGCRQNQTVVDHCDAGDDDGALCIVSCDPAASRSRHDGGERNTRQSVLADTGAVYHHGVCIRYTRYRCGRLLYACTLGGQPGAVHRHPFDILSDCNRFRTRRISGDCRLGGNIHRQHRPFLANNHRRCGIGDVCAEYIPSMGAAQSGGRTSKRQ